MKFNETNLSMWKQYLVTRRGWIEDTDTYYDNEDVGEHFYKAYRKLIRHMKKELKLIENFIAMTEEDETNLRRRNRL